MKVLICGEHEFAHRTRPFEERLEPLAQRMDAAVATATTRLSHYKDRPKKRPVLERYCAIMRWPIRKLEYSYVLEAAGTTLEGQRVFEAGCGVVPLGHCFAAQGAEVHALDGDAALVHLLRHEARELYGSTVQYHHGDLRRTGFAADHFHTVTCVSVLEHLPRGADRAVLSELLRVLRPGGLLIATVDLIADDWVRPDAAPARPRSWLRQLFRRALGRAPGHTTTPYRYDEATRELLAPFHDALVGQRQPPPRLSTEAIRRFWRAHWFDGAGYEEASGRWYVSLAFALRK